MQTYLNVCLCRLSGCFITEEGCSVLATALTSNPLHLRELDLSCNHPGVLGGQLLTARLNDPTCKLEILKYVANFYCLVQSSF